jgi:hypothetical protein
MRISQAKLISEHLVSLIENNDLETAYSSLCPILSERTPFSSLSLIGSKIGACPTDPVNELLVRIASDETMGGWVIIGSALGAQLNQDFQGSFHRCNQYIISADSWYGSDIMAERTPGPALVLDFNKALENLTAWREDPNHWVRRAAGVSVHYWAKKSAGNEIHLLEAKKLLDFLTPMFSEWDMDAAKGVGWGLKTLGKHYPELVTPWLTQQVINPQIRYRAIVLRKSLTYLPEAEKKQVLSKTA